MDSLRTMLVRTTQMNGPVVVEPAVHGDDRGFFVETYRKSAMIELGLPAGLSLCRRTTLVPGVAWFAGCTCRSEVGWPRWCAAHAGQSLT